MYDLQILDWKSDEEIKCQIQGSNFILTDQKLNQQIIRSKLDPKIKMG